MLGKFSFAKTSFGHESVNEVSPSFCLLFPSGRAKQTILFGHEKYGFLTNSDRQNFHTFLKAGSPSLSKLLKIKLHKTS